MLEDLVDDLVYGDKLVHVRCGFQEVIERESTWSEYKREYYCLHCREVIHILYKEMVREPLEDML